MILFRLISRLLSNHYLKYGNHYTYISITNHYFSTKSKLNDKNTDQEIEMDLNEEEIKEAEIKTAKRRAKEFKFNEEFDDYESYQKWKGK